MIFVANRVNQCHARKCVCVKQLKHFRGMICSSDGPVAADTQALSPENAAESQRLLVLVAGLMRDLPAGVEPFGLLTVRADSAARLYQAIAEQNLEVPKTLPLLPLPRTSYRDVIVKPIEVAARHGKRISIQASLTERLVADATGADALPLLAFTLLQLYKGFSAGDKLTVEQYEAIGGVAGSIKEAIKQALASPASGPVIPAAPKEQLDCLRAAFIPWLARIDPVSGEPMAHCRSERIRRIFAGNGRTADRTTIARRRSTRRQRRRRSRRREHARIGGARRKTRRPGKYFKAFAVEIRFSAESLPAPHRDDGLEVHLVSEMG